MEDKAKTPFFYFFLTTLLWSGVCLPWMCGKGNSWYFQRNDLMSQYSCCHAWESQRQKILGCCITSAFGRNCYYCELVVGWVQRHSPCCYFNPAAQYRRTNMWNMSVRACDNCCWTPNTLPRSACAVALCGSFPRLVILRLCFICPCWEDLAVCVVVA